MTERLRSASTAGYPGPKMESDLSPRKTMLVLVIVVGCFAVLWPKVFYPMLVGSANQHLKPSPIDKATGCCDVISETDVNTIKIMSELCGTIVKSAEDGTPLSGKEIVRRCRQEVLDTCGIDISVVLQEQVRLGQSVKQILDEVRSLNGSLCLKYNYGVAPWRLGVPHRITVKTADSPNIRQERPMHLRSELVHPAFRERGRAIPQPQPAPPARPPPRVVEGRPGPVPGMRPTIGGAGHVVPPSKQGTSSMSVLMPIYTIGIVIFFTYTLIKIIFKKQPEGVGGSLYPPIDPDPNFRKEVFESESSRLGPKLTRENISSKLVVNAMSALLDEVDQEIEARRKSSEVASQDLVNGTLSNGDAVKPQDEDQPTVKVLGMEMTASCEGGKKWSRPDSPMVPTPSPLPPAEPAPPPQEIYLEGALPAQSHLLVADSATNPEPTTGEDPAVVLSGKMTLSVISLDSENGSEETANGIEDVIIEKETVSEKIIRDVQEPVVTATEEIQDNLVIEKELIPEKTVEGGIQKSVATNIEEAIAKAAEEIEERLEAQQELISEKIVEEDIQKSVATNIEEAITEGAEEIEGNLIVRKELIPEHIVEDDIQKSIIANIEEVIAKAAEDIEETLREKDLIPEKIIDDDIQKSVTTNAEEAIAKAVEEKSPVTIEQSPFKQHGDIKEPQAYLEEEKSPVTVEESILNAQNDLEKPVTKLQEETVQTAVETKPEETTVKPPTEEIITREETLEHDVEKSGEKLEDSILATTNIQEATLKFVEELLKEEDKLIVPEVRPQVENKTEEPATKVEEVTVQEPVITNTQQSIKELRNEDLLTTTEENPLAEIEASLSNVEEGVKSSEDLEKDIEEFLQKLREQSDFQAPTITLGGEDVPHTLEVESLEKEVDDLIQEALESIQQKEIASELSASPDEKTNEISNDIKEKETIGKIAETSQPQSDTQRLVDTLGIGEISPKIELKKEFSSEIEKLIQEVKDLPVVEPKLEIKNVLQDNELEARTTHTIDEKKPTQGEILISEKIEESISKIDVQQSQEKPDVKAEQITHSTDSRKIEESATSKEDSSKSVSEQREETDSVSKKGDSAKISELDVEKSQKIEEGEKIPPQESVTSKTEDLKSDEKLSGELSSEEIKASNVAVEEQVEKVNAEDVSTARSSSNIEPAEEKLKAEEDKLKSNDTDDEELGSDEELVEEIEEIVYEEESGDEEEIEIEVEESDEEILDERNTNRTESSSVQRVNGERSEDLVEESKYTTVSGATAAENEISDEELTDNEEEEEIMEVEEEIEDEDYINQGGNDVNHVSGESEPEH